MASPFESLILSQLSILLPNGPTWQTYTPVWTQSGASPAIGNGTLVGAFTKIGHTCLGRIEIAFGSTTNFGSGGFPWLFTLPLTPTVPATNERIIGSWGGLAAASFFSGVAYVNTAGTLGMFGYSVSNSVETTSPATWTSTNRLSISFQYETVS